MPDANTGVLTITSEEFIKLGASSQFQELNERSEPMEVDLHFPSNSEIRISLATENKHLPENVPSSQSQMPKLVVIGSEDSKNSRNEESEDKK